MSYEELMPESNSSLLEAGQIIPAFSLPGTDGMPHGPWDYKQREHLLLLFLRSVTTSESRGLLRQFARQYRTVREEQCAILAVTPDTIIASLETQEILHLPFPLLTDVKGSVISRYTQWDETGHACQPALILADRYNALYAQWVAENEAALPSLEEILESLRYLNKLCTP
jgi:peroxiredoxin